MAEKKKTTKRVAKREEVVETTSNRSLVYILYAIGIIVCVALAQYFSMKDVTENVLAEVGYKQESSTSYRVFYDENQFYDEIYMGEGQNYVASLVNDIEVDFNYFTRFTNSVDLSYAYDVNASLYVYEPGETDYKDKSKHYWKKDYELAKQKTVNLADIKDYKIKKNVIIDFKKYRDEFEKYRANNRISVDGMLIVTFRVHPVLVKYPGIEQFKYNAVMTLEIPVSESTFKINKEASHSKEMQYERFTETEEKEKVYYMIICALLWLLAFLLSLFFILTYRNDAKKEGEYARKLKKILDSYDNIIVNVEKLPVLAGLSVVNVTTFEELVDAQAEVRLPINFKEDKKKKVSKFILVRNNLAWVYTLKEGEEGEIK